MNIERLRKAQEELRKLHLRMESEDFSLLDFTKEAEAFLDACGGDLRVINAAMAAYRDEELEKETPQEKAAREEFEAELPPELLRLLYDPIPDYGELFRDGRQDEADVWLAEVAARFGAEALDPEGVETLGSALSAMDPYQVGITLEVHSTSEVDACFFVPALSAAEAAEKARLTLREAADGLALERSDVVSVSMVVSSVVPPDRLSGPWTRDWLRRRARWLLSEAGPEDAGEAQR